ncbi:unnamed protein product [Nyctereutes procyonoides]|uniref:(raccoon dog) hypothetical protein n=1 Tax=Nyctereutes procyonoides TaxID=34880 RepID=A0A811YC50_NYCPR|nr:unnamed protein product [Nyctereutes procyonoides]
MPTEPAEVLPSKEQSTGNTTTVVLNWKTRLPPGQFGILMPFCQKKKKGISPRTRVIYPNYQEEIGLLLSIEETQAEGKAGSMQGARRGTQSRVSSIMHLFCFPETKFAVIRILLETITQVEKWQIKPFNFWQH